MSGPGLFYTVDVLRAAMPDIAFDDETYASWHVDLHAWAGAASLGHGWVVVCSTVHTTPFPHATEWVVAHPEHGRVYGTIVGGRHAAAGPSREVLARFCRECAPALYVHAWSKERPRI